MNKEHVNKYYYYSLNRRHGFRTITVSGRLKAMKMVMEVAKEKQPSAVLNYCPVA